MSETIISKSIFNHSIWLKLLFLFIFLCSGIFIFNSFVILQDDVLYYRITSLVVFLTYLILMPLVFRSKIIIKEDSIIFVGYNSKEILFSKITDLYSTSFSQYYLKVGKKKFSLNTSFPGFDKATLLIWERIKLFSPDLITTDFQQRYSKLYRSVIFGKILYNWLKRYGLLYVIFIFITVILTFYLPAWLKPTNSILLFFSTIYAISFPIIPLLSMMSNLNSKLKDIHMDSPVDDLVERIYNNTGFAKVLIICSVIYLVINGSLYLF